MPRVCTWARDPCSEFASSGTLIGLGEARRLESIESAAADFLDRLGGGGYFIPLSYSPFFLASKGELLVGLSASEFREDNETYECKSLMEHRSEEDRVEADGVCRTHK